MKKKFKDLRGKSRQELGKETIKLREEIAKLMLERKVNQAKDTNILTKKRKTLAVVLTILTEKKEIENLKR